MTTFLILALCVVVLCAGACFGVAGWHNGLLTKSLAMEVTKYIRTIPEGGNYFWC
jgi:hypothetical protein